MAETAAFSRRREQLKIGRSDYEAMLDIYTQRPSYGEVIVGTGGLRKGRVAKSDTGKSGGYRVFSLYLGITVPVYLLWVIDKTGEENITAEQKKMFRTIIGQIKTELGR